MGLTRHLTREIAEPIMDSVLTTVLTRSLSIDDANAVVAHVRNNLAMELSSRD